MVTGSIYERKGIYYAIVSYYVDGRRKQKSVSTGLPVKGNKRRALEFLENLKRQTSILISIITQNSSPPLLSVMHCRVKKIEKNLWKRVETKKETLKNQGF